MILEMFFLKRIYEILKKFSLGGLTPYGGTSRAEL